METSFANVGVRLEEGGIVTNDGIGLSASVTVVGTGGSSSVGSNFGVAISGDLPAKITSSGGPAAVQ